MGFSDYTICPVCLCDVAKYAYSEHMIKHFKEGDV